MLSLGNPIGKSGTWHGLSLSGSSISQYSNHCSYRVWYLSRDEQLRSCSDGPVVLLVRGEILMRHYEGAMHTMDDESPNVVWIFSMKASHTDTVSINSLEAVEEQTSLLLWSSTRQSMDRTPALFSVLVSDESCSLAGVPRLGTKPRSLRCHLKTKYGQPYIPRCCYSVHLTLICLP